MNRKLRPEGCETAAKKVKRIMKRSDLIILAQELGVRKDWHEPDEQEVTAEYRGSIFDNAGFWPEENLVSCEKYILIKKDGEPKAMVNLATLFAFACGTYEG